ncbi:MAG: hypothetical protein QMC79_05735 [Anaerosomatales bacterium]|nr:hypothetical protein [Anaerosomatales bacterium]
MGPYVHYELTYRWALDEGMAETVAERVARADVGYDQRFPARRSLRDMSRHFAPTAWLWSRAHLRRALALGSADDLGLALHTAQDAIAHGRLGLGHIVLRLGGRNPDDWSLAPPRIRRAIEETTRRYVRAFAAAWPMRVSSRARTDS